MDFENMDPELGHSLVMQAIPSVLATLAARMMDSTGELMFQVSAEQVEMAEKMGLTGVEFGLIKLMASERVLVWLLRSLSELTNVAPGHILLEMQDCIAESGIVGMFGTGEGR